jgi:tetratricopeptide (TPR) repeat protein
MSSAPVRLSQSRLWTLQRRYFDEQGIRAWTEAVVPQYITSNPWIAASYAAVTAAWLRDLATTGALDISQPLYIAELGCGSGRFGFHFLGRLLADLSRSPLRALQVRYVYTDFTEYNLDFLRSHGSLQRFVAAGSLDFARFDLESDRELHLTSSGETVSAATLANPLAVIANYVFDGVPQDCFRVAGGELYEDLVRTDPHATDVQDVIRSWKQRRATGDPYPDPSWNRVLQWYRDHFDDTAISFPCAALTCLRNLRDLARGRLLVLSGDKGYAHAEIAAEEREPAFAVHGSVSMMVDYHAIGRWVSDEGGTFLRTLPRASTFTVTASLFGTGPWEETRLAFDSEIDGRGPDDFFTLKHAVERSYGDFTVEELLAWLRLSRWDHHIFLGCLPALLARADMLSTIERRELRAVAAHVWDTYFPIREPRDLPFHLGILLMEIHEPAEALAMFARSVELYGPAGTTLLNIALCHEALGQSSEAARSAEAALELDPGLEAAGVLLARHGK